MTVYISRPRVMVGYWLQSKFFHVLRPDGRSIGHKGTPHYTSDRARVEAWGLRLCPGCAKEGG